MATGTSPTASAPVFHSDDPAQTTEYRTLSVLAIISLIMGLAAPVAIAAPFLLAIPFLGVFVSLVALRRIAVSGGVLAGGWAATVGLVLCIASAVLPISHDVFQRVIRVQQAEAFGRNWVGLVTSGNLKQAFGLTIEAVRSQPAAEPNAPPRPAPYDEFVKQPAIKALEAAGENAKIEVRDTLEFQAQTYRYIMVRQLYAVSPASAASAGAAAQPIEVVISVQRATSSRESMSRWLVASCVFSKPADAATKQ
jgi:hypothetical protein